MKNSLIEKFDSIINSVANNTPLVHCLTNNISINQAANVVLMTGANPIMAEHPKEVYDITKSASALTVNLGNISDSKLKAIMVSGQSAVDNNIPSIIDVVGVACSGLRLGFAKRYIEEFKPRIIKGNISEIKAICGLKTDSVGVDAGEKDLSADVNCVKELAIELAKKTNAVVFITGKTDVIADSEKAVCINNGVKELSRVTGTGCMLTTLTGAYLTTGYVFEAAVLSAVVMGVSGELADSKKGLATFQLDLLDKISTVNIKTLEKMMKID